jgi:SAM-dependent methyltransferase
MKYDFGFTWDSTYGYAARLVGAHADVGGVVDLGCGLGTFSQPIVELGFDYQGFEYDPDSVDECRRRGVACEPIDLHDAEHALERVIAVVGDRRVVAVSLLDVVEHLPDPAVVLAGVARLLDALASDGHPPLLVLSIPNVAHADLGAKLALGRWDVTETGLLDATHITLFTHDRLVATTEAAGLVEVGRNDVVFPDTEQRFPPDHPAVAHDTPVNRFLHALRLGADPWGHTYQFVRAYRRGPGAEMSAHVDPIPHRCTLVVPTVGGVGLSATLASLAAQNERANQPRPTTTTDQPAASPKRSSKT